MKFRLACLAVTMVVLPCLSEVSAHHSQSSYNLEQQVTIKGAITRVQWVNPHVFFYIDQETSTGDILNWVVEGLNPAGMRRIGWSRNTLSLGDSISVTGNPGKNSANPRIYPRLIYRGEENLFDEAAFYAGVFNTPQDSARRATSLDGNWKVPLTPPLVAPRQFGSNLHDLTTRAVDALDEFDELTMNPAINCGQLPAPLIMHYGDLKQITLGENEISIKGDYDGGERIIYMNVNSHEGATESTQGHSIGRWEGNLLIIDTTHFAINNYGIANGLPSSSQKHLTERIIPAEDGKSLTYQFELSDPEYLASPLVFETEWTYQPDLEFFVEECDLESAGQFLNN